MADRTLALGEANRLDLAAAPGFGLTDAPDGPACGSLPRGSRRLSAAWKRWWRLPEPIGEVISSSIRPNGLEVQKVRVPLGVIFFIYESRPNVTADAAALCVKSGNAVILRGGKEAAAFQRGDRRDPGRSGRRQPACPATPCNWSTTTDREAVGHFCACPSTSTWPSLAAARG